MRRCPTLASLAILLATFACGGGDSCPVLIYFIDDGSPPTFLGYREGSGEWTIPKVDSDGTFHMCVSAQIEVVSVCQHTDGSFDAEELFALSSEQTELQSGGCNGSGSAQITVSGTVATAGVLAIGTQTEQGSAANWPYTLNVPPDTYDVVASSSILGGSGNVVIDRGEVFNSDSSFDVDPSTGTPLVSEALQLDGLGSAGASDVLIVTTTYTTATTQANVAESAGSQTLAVPAEAVPAGDDQFITINALGSAGTDQVIEALFATGSATPAFSFLPTLDTTTFTPDVPGVMWTEIPAFTDGEFQLVTPGSGSATTPFSFARVTFSASWQEANQVKQMAFDTSAPGFQDAWKIDNAVGYNEALLILLESLSTTMTTSVSRLVTPTAGAAPPSAPPPKLPPGIHAVGADVSRRRW